MIAVKFIVGTFFKTTNVKMTCICKTWQRLQLALLF